LGYNTQTETFAKHIAGYELHYGVNEVAAFANTNPDYLDFYKNKYKTGWNYQTFESLGNQSAWRKWLANCDKKYLILCNPSIEWNAQYLAIAKEYFPCTDSIYNGFITDVYILKKDSDGCKPAVRPSFDYSFDDTAGVRRKYKEE